MIEAGERRRVAQFPVQAAIRGAGGSVDQVQGDPRQPGLGQEGDRRPGLRLGVGAAEEAEPPVVERLDPEAHAGHAFRDPPKRRPGIARHVLRVRFEDDERRGDDEVRVAERAEDVVEEARRRERRGASPEVHRVGREARAAGVPGPESDLAEKRLVKAAEAAGPVPRQRRHREVAVRADPDAEGHVHVEPRRGRAGAVSHPSVRRRGSTSGRRRRPPGESAPAPPASSAASLPSGARAACVCG